MSHPLHSPWQIAIRGCTPARWCHKYCPKTPFTKRYSRHRIGTTKPTRVTPAGLPSWRWLPVGRCKTKRSVLFCYIPEQQQIKRTTHLHIFSPLPKHTPLKLQVVWPRNVGFQFNWKPPRAFLWVRGEQIDPSLSSTRLPRREVACDEPPTSTDKTPVARRFRYQNIFFCI